MTTAKAKDVTVEFLLIVGSMQRDASVRSRKEIGREVLDAYTLMFGNDKHVPQNELKRYIAQIQYLSKAAQSRLS